MGSGARMFSAMPLALVDGLSLIHIYDILIIHDNAYSDIIFDGAVGNSFFNTPGAMDVGVEFFSLSKSFNVTGARTVSYTHLDVYKRQGHRLPQV